MKNISFRDALEQSLAGRTASLIIPNQIGDYGAKAINYTKPFRTKIVLLNLLGNMAQITMMTLIGIVGFIIFTNRYEIDVNFYRIMRFVFILLIISLFPVFGVKQKRFKIKGFSFEHIIRFIKKIPIKTHSINLIISLLRYLIFSFQFYYLLTMFGVDVDYNKAMVVIISMYFFSIH